MRILIVLLTLLLSSCSMLLDVGTIVADATDGPNEREVKLATSTPDGCKYIKEYRLGYTGNGYQTQSALIDGLKSQVANHNGDILVVGMSEKNADGNYAGIGSGYKCP